MKKHVSSYLLNLLPSPNFFFIPLIFFLSKRLTPNVEVICGIIFKECYCLSKTHWLGLLLSSIKYRYTVDVLLIFYKFCLIE